MSQVMVFETLSCRFLELHSQMADAMLFVDDFTHSRQQFIGLCSIPRFQDYMGRKGMVIVGDIPSVNVVYQCNTGNVLNISAQAV